MLETSLFESAGRAKTRKPATVLLSTLMHAIAVVVLLLVPLVQPHVVPLLSATPGLPVFGVKRDEPPQRDPSYKPPAIQPHIQVSPEDFVQPTVIPPDIARVVDDPGSPVVPYVGVGRDSVGDLLRRIVPPQEDSSIAPPPPPSPPPPAPAALAPIRVSSGAQQGKLIEQVRPAYPPIAKMARVQGAVELEAVIGKDGQVHNLKVISGHPLLVDAAVAAVQQWRYEPTVLNSEPVEVITTIIVRFALQ